MNAESLIKSAFKTKFFRPRAGPLFAGWTRGRSNLVVIVGDNATGKSFYRRMVQVLCHKAKVECVHISMEGRSDAGWQRALIYGTEQWQATGKITAHTILMAIKTANDRTRNHVIVLDEPDVGLSDEYVLGAANALTSFSMKMPKHTRAFFVITHRRVLVEGLLEAKPHVLIFGKQRPATIQEWLERPIKAADLSELEKKNHAMFKAIQPLLRER
ncbi:hypothetical protein Rctr197k_160 [Virus Rctr197k]|nr:hypothetical protein Rctr197k_160 [Virus Rctr197k]